MDKWRSVVVGLVVAFSVVAFASSAQAQATRTWVSGVGDDANPCSRTAPCKTFAGAISKTAAGGEINAIDPGGFGAVTITKAITIDGGGTFASILAAGVNGVIVNAGAANVVTLRNLSINGVGTGVNGIRFLSGAALNVENVSILKFTGHGIDAVITGTGLLNVINTTITNCNVGVRLQATVLGLASIDRSRVHLCNIGVQAVSNTRATVRDSDLSLNRTGGSVGAQADTGAEVNVERSLFAYLTTGLLANGGIARVATSTFMNIAGTALSAQAGGQTISLSNNNFAGNTADGVPTTSILPK